MRKAKGHRINKRRAGGFTIIELLVVIVVVGILAGITVVAYSGVRDRASRAAVEATASQVLKRIEFAKSEDGLPQSVTDCPTPTGTNICLPSSGVTYRYKALTTAAAAGYSGTLARPAYEISVEDDSNFLYSSTAETRGGNEFMQYTDMAPLINKYGFKKYQISFDIKSEVAGVVSVYMQNGSGSRYTFAAVPISATTNFTRHTIVVTPANWMNTETRSILAFYGTYGTGRIPTVKNLDIRLAQ